MIKSRLKDYQQMTLNPLPSTVIMYDLWHLHESSLAKTGGGTDKVSKGIEANECNTLEKQTNKMLSCYKI